MSGAMNDSSQSSSLTGHNVLFSDDDVCNHLDKIPTILSKEFEIPIIQTL